MPKIIFTDHAIKKLAAEKGQVNYFEKQRMRAGHTNRGLSLALSVSYGGSKTWYSITYCNGKPKWTKLGRYPELSLSQARDAAWSYFENPAKFVEKASVDSFKDIAEQWFQRHVLGNNLRSKDEVRRQLERYIYPNWGARKFTDIRRPEVAVLLDKLEDNHGNSQAGACFATLRSIMGWYEGRSETYKSPVIRAMSTRFKKSARDRILNDDEIRAIWADDSRFGSFVKLCLLTAQRQVKVTTMRWDDITDGTWAIQTEVREKGNAERIRLPDIALQIIDKLPRVAGNPFVFWGKGIKSFNSHAQQKRELDARLPAMPSWVLHDLRRTARSLMSRAGVRPDVAERVLGHRITGIAGIYDRHKYEQEKSDALNKLASLIDRIIHPDSNVVPLRHG